MLRVNLADNSQNVMLSKEQFLCQAERLTIFTGVQGWDAGGGGGGGLFTERKVVTPHSAFWGGGLAFAQALLWFQ